MLPACTWVIMDNIKTGYTFIEILGDVQWSVSEVLMTNLEG